MQRFHVSLHYVHVFTCISTPRLDISARFGVGVLAQLVERLVRNEKVRGSNPLGSTRFFLLPIFSWRSQHLL